MEACTPPVPPKPPWPPLPCTPLGTALLTPPSLQEGAASVPSCAAAAGPTWLSQFWKRNRRLSSVQPREPNVRALGGSPGPWLPEQTERVGDLLSSQTLLPFQIRCSLPGATVGDSGWCLGTLQASRWGCSGRRGAGGSAVPLRA